MHIRKPLRFYTAEVSEADLVTYLQCILRMPKYNIIKTVICQYNNQIFYA